MNQNKLLKPTSKEECLRIVGSLYVIMTEKLLNRIIEVTGLDEERANALRILMFKHTGNVIVKEKAD
jgi:hypothetical protein